MYLFLAAESLQFNGLDYLLWKQPVDLNDHATEISLRFNTARNSGILLFAKGRILEDGYMLLELFEKSLIFYFKTKGKMINGSSCLTYRN